MNLGDVLIWESVNVLLLIPMVIGFVILARWFRGRPMFTERDWLLLFGYPKKQALRPKRWIKFLGAVVIVVLVGLAELWFILPHGEMLFLAALALTAILIVILTPKILA